MNHRRRRASGPIVVIFVVLVTNFLPTVTQVGADADASSVQALQEVLHDSPAVGVLQDMANLTSEAAFFTISDELARRVAHATPPPTSRSSALVAVLRASRLAIVVPPTPSDIVLRWNSLTSSPSYVEFTDTLIGFLTTPEGESTLLSLQANADALGPECLAAIIATLGVLGTLQANAIDFVNCNGNVGCQQAEIQDMRDLAIAGVFTGVATLILCANEC